MAVVCLCIVMQNVQRHWSLCTSCRPRLYVCAASANRRPQGDVVRPQLQPYVYLQTSETWYVLSVVYTRERVRRTSLSKIIQCPLVHSRSSNQYCMRELARVNAAVTTVAEQFFSTIRRQ